MWWFLAKSAQILNVMSDRTDIFHELWNKGYKQNIKAKIENKDNI